MVFIRLQSLVPQFIRNIFVRIAAKRDVPRYMAPYVVATWLGKMPAFTPRTNAEHARINADRKLPKEVSEWKRKLQEKKEALTEYSSRWLLRAILAFLYGAEVFGDIQLLIMLNVEGFRRTLMSLALAFFIFFITWYCTSAKERTIWWKWAVAAYAAIAIAIAIVQIHGTPTTDDATLLSNIAGGVIMVVATAGTALVAHFIIERLLPAQKCWREIVLHQKNIARAEAAKRRADTYVARIERQRIIWIGEAEQIVSVYARTFVRNGGSLPPDVRTRLGIVEPDETPVDDSNEDHPDNPYQDVGGVQ